MTHSTEVKQTLYNLSMSACLTQQQQMCYCNLGICGEAEKCQEGLALAIECIKGREDMQE